MMPPILTEERAELLMRLINAIRNTQGIGALSDAQMMTAVDDWHEALCDVPDGELTMLRLRGVRRGLKTVAEFAAMWEETERKRRDQERAELLERETEAMRHFDEQRRAEDRAGVPESPERRTFRCQSARLKRGVPALCCECKSENDFPLAAILDRSGRVWECVNGQCDFSQPFEGEATSS